MGETIIDGRGETYKLAINEDGSINIGDIESLNDISINTNEGDNLRTSNPNQEQLLTDILKQLKIMNIHLSILSDNNIQKTEID